MVADYFADIHEVKNRKENFSSSKNEFLSTLHEVHVLCNGILFQLGVLAALLLKATSMHQNLTLLVVYMQPFLAQTF